MDWVWKSNDVYDLMKLKALGQPMQGTKQKYPSRMLNSVIMNACNPVYSNGRGVLRTVVALRSNVVIQRNNGELRGEVVALPLLFRVS